MTFLLLPGIKGLRCTQKMKLDKQNEIWFASWIFIFNVKKNNNKKPLFAVVLLNSRNVKFQKFLRIHCECVSTSFPKCQLFHYIMIKNSGKLVWYLMSRKVDVYCQQKKKLSKTVQRPGHQERSQRTSSYYISS